MVKTQIARITGGKAGRLANLSKSKITHFPLVQLRYNKTEGHRVEIYTENPNQGIPSEQCIESHLNSIQGDFKLDYTYRHEDNGNGQAPTPINQREVYEDNRILELENSELKSDLEKITTQSESFENDSISTLEELEKVKGDYDTISLRSTELESKNNELENRNSDLEKCARPLDDPYPIMLAYLSDAADKIDAFESEIVNKNLTVSNVKSIEAIVRDAKKNDIAEDLDDLGKIIENYYSESEEDLKGFIEIKFEEENQEDYENYKEKKKSVIAINESINKLNPDTHQAFISLMRDQVALEEEVVKAYEINKETFVETYSEKISEYAMALEDELDKKKMKEIAEEMDLEKIPFYINMSEDAEQYTLKFFMPTKRKGGKICDRLVPETMLNEDLVSLVSKSEVENISDDFDSKYNLRFFTLNLPKELYKEFQVSEIESTMRTSLKTGYKNTNFEEIGLGIDLLFGREINKHYKSPEPIVLESVKGYLLENAYTFEQICDSLREDHPEINETDAKSFAKRALNILKKDSNYHNNSSNRNKGRDSKPTTHTLKIPDG
jgi:hypothetical protein|tara:strand:- start:1774 stop:3435 length:1662 start_codon:yes stop_codon:yes gene_type:complete